ncbi:hypothetical protein CYMTET_36875 [Cymbomonas tetramitiformis]|uniref:Uncharacterized protein n=1 Tax=Cymbomonas tetramitiformis TaxID=36881 RepID=A0AAE0F775_9CHLO|nr:hypothetical protein CYMTET_36875 [Cymbomonas tetramitiformis]
MVRDCRLLDNRFGWGEVDVLFYAMDTAGGGRDDNKLMWEEFQALMHTLSKRLFPKLSPAEALLRLQTEHLIKFGKNATQKHTQHEKLLTPKVMWFLIAYLSVTRWTSSEL